MTEHAKGPYRAEVEPGKVTAWMVGPGLRNTVIVPDERAIRLMNLAHAQGRAEVLERVKGLRDWLNERLDKPGITAIPQFGMMKAKLDELFPEVRS